MTTTRESFADRMAATLEAWSAQIADLQAKGCSAGGEQQARIGRQVADLQKHRTEYAQLMRKTLGPERGRVSGTCGRVPSGWRPEFRKTYMQATSRFAFLSLLSSAEPAASPLGLTTRPEPRQITPMTKPVDDPTHQPQNRHLRAALLAARDRRHPTRGDVHGGDRRAAARGPCPSPAYRRVATTIFLPARPGDLVSGQLTDHRSAGAGRG